MVYCDDSFTRKNFADDKDPVISQKLSFWGMQHGLCMSYIVGLCQTGAVPLFAASRYLDEANDDFKGVPWRTASVLVNEQPHSHSQSVALDHQLLTNAQLILIIKNQKSTKSQMIDWWAVVLVNVSSFSLGTPLQKYNLSPQFATFRDPVQSTGVYWSWVKTTTVAFLRGDAPRAIGFSNQTLIPRMNIPQTTRPVWLGRSPTHFWGWLIMTHIHHKIYVWGSCVNKALLGASPHINKFVSSHVAMELRRWRWVTW